jgi:uncharacterized protein with HEPN domain
MRKDNSYLFDILNACELIEQFIGKTDYQTFQIDVMRQDAVIRRIEIIGEAVALLSNELKDQHPEVPWGLIRGMRSRLVHNNNEIDIELVWNVLKGDIPNLHETVKRSFPEL